MNKLAFTAVVVATVGITGTALAVVAFDQNVTPDVIFGSGNSNGNFTTDSHNGVEIGLRAKIPFVGLTNSNGDGTYIYTLAETDHDSNGATANRWNFDWTVNTDFDDSTGFNIDEFTYELGLDGDPGLETDFLKFDPIHSNDPIGGTNCADHAFGNNLTGNGAGSFVDIDDCRSATPAVKDAATATYAGFISANNVAQQSWRYAFFPVGALAAYDPDVAGTYAVYLLAKDSNGEVVARSYIQVLIGGALPAGQLLACEGFEAPLDADVSVNKPNRVLPLRMTLVDGAGIPWTDTDITASPVLQLTYNDGGYPDGFADLEELETAGKGDDGNMFVFNGSNWAFNMRTKGLASGNYTITVVSGDLAEYVIDPTCEVSLTIL